MKLKIVLFILFTATLLWSESNQTSNSIDTNSTSKKKTSSQVNNHIQDLLLEERVIEKELSENNTWSKIYSSYHTFQLLKKQRDILSAKIEALTKRKELTKKQKKQLKEYRESTVLLDDKLQQLKEYEDNPFKKIINPPTIESVPTVGNPFAIIGALSYQKKLNSDQEDYQARYESMQHLVKQLEIKDILLQKIQKLDSNNTNYAKKYKNNKEEIKTFSPILDIFKTTNIVYSKKIEEIKINLKENIKKEIEKTISIGAVILFFILLLLLIKYLVRKYMSDNDRFYTINKALNITFILVSILTLLLAYIENVSYLVTILGFASAGIAIAMKDWFMSLMGWFTIVLGGSIHVGDRVKFQRGDIEYIGDIVDISMLRMTLHEDVTLTAYMHNRRAGRIIFVPNNFIFTDMIANYSHAGLKTVWDGVDFMITFDSDIQKAASIAKDVTRKYSKGYTDITRKQLNKLRSKYNIRNTNVEPRILTFIEPYGMKVSAWYLTNSFATLTLRSTISAEIISRIQEEEGVTLAFPTQSIYVDKDVRKPVPKPQDIPMGEETF